MKKLLNISENSNRKQLGEIGERITIGELAKLGIDVLLPLSDNLPFDLCLIYKNQIYKCQVKSSFQTNSDDKANNSVAFSLTSSNWYSKTQKSYTKEEVDLFLLCDGTNVYIFNFEELSKKKNIILRYSQSQNKQVKKVNFANDYLLSLERLEKILI